MFEIRQIIQRLRMGESVRQIARSQHVGRATVESIHGIALTQNWLDPLGQIPDDTTLATFFKAPRKAPQNASSVEPFREEILQWHAQGINATTMRRALHQKHGYSGSVYALYRFLNHEVPKTPEATIKLEFGVGEMAQVDFGMGPAITERKTGEIRKTWIFVCTLAWSRHQYAEIVRNQSIETWLACHRHAFEWFNGVPKKMRIDNLKAAITKACYYEPTVQRSYGELAIGYSFLIDPCPVEDPRKKGRVESGVKYVKNNFVPLRDFHSVAHANEQLRAWVMSEAGNRIHGSTRERPTALIINIGGGPPAPEKFFLFHCHASELGKLAAGLHGKEKSQVSIAPGISPLLGPLAAQDSGYVNFILGIGQVVNCGRNVSYRSHHLLAVVPFKVCRQVADERGHFQVAASPGNSSLGFAQVDIQNLTFCDFQQIVQAYGLDHGSELFRLFCSGCTPRKGDGLTVQINEAGTVQKRRPGYCLAQVIQGAHHGVDAPLLFRGG